MWDSMTQEAPFFFSRDSSIRAVVHSPSCCSTGSEKQALKENLCQPGAQHGPIYSASQAGSTLHSKSWSATPSCCQYPGSQLTVPRGDVCAVLCCGVWWSWDGDKCWDESHTLTGEEEPTLSSLLLHSWLPLVIHCHSPGPAVLNSGAVQWYQYDDMTVLWCEVQFSEPALDHLVLLCMCSKCPSLMPGWGWWTGCLGTGRKSGQRQVHPPSVLSPQLTRLLLPSARADLSWSNLHEGRYPGPRQEIMRGKTTEDLPMPLTGTSVSTGKFPEMKDTQQAKSALAFRLSRKGSEISNHGHASLTGTWLPGHKLIRINDRR